MPLSYNPPVYTKDPVLEDEESTGRQGVSLWLIKDALSTLRTH